MIHVKFFMPNICQSRLYFTNFSNESHKFWRGFILHVKFEQQQIIDILQVLRCKRRMTSCE